VELRTGCLGSLDLADTLVSWGWCVDSETSLTEPPYRELKQKVSSYSAWTGTSIYTQTALTTGVLLDRILRILPVAVPLCVQVEDA
jgi:hypothetical protein